MMQRRLKLGVALLLVVCLYWMIDFVSNGSIVNFIYETFFYLSEYYDGAGILHQVTIPIWDKFKVAGLLLLILVILFCTVYIRKKVSKVRAENVLMLEQLLQSFQNKEKLPVLKEEYAGIEKNLLQIRHQQENQIRMLELQTRQKSDLISYLAHDMKTPLASVIGYLNLLNDVKDVPQEQKERYIEITLDKANRLESLIDEFFDITRFNLHDIVISPVRIELNFMFQQLRDQFYPIMIKQDKTIQLEIDEALLLYADADKLARAFNNILKNAISYSYEHTTIMISAKVIEERISIEFHNQGDEIPQQKLQTIFEKFYRLDKARSTNAGGAGLGLAIAKEIIEAHDGTIDAKSDQQGTVFTVVLPMRKREEVYVTNGTSNNNELMYDI